MNNNLLSIRKAAEYLDVTEDCLRKWDKDGKLKPFKTAGGHRRYKQEDLDKFVGINEEPYPVYKQTDSDLITVADAIERGWCWIEPYFHTQNICRDSVESLKELFVDYMHSTIGNYHILGKRYVDGKIK